jgi:hypothetical protein
MRGLTARAVLIAAVVVLIAGCGGDDSGPTTTAKGPATPFKPTKAQKADCKDFGGVSANQRWVSRALPGGTRCKDDVITNGQIAVSRPDGGWKTLAPRPEEVGG